jgi:hypothetical protein
MKREFKAMIDPVAVAKMAADYTAAWNSKSAQQSHRFMQKTAKSTSTKVSRGVVVCEFRTWRRAFLRMFPM